MMKERLFVHLPGDAQSGPETTVPAGALRAFAVDDALAGHVSRVLCYRETFAPGEEVIERVLPDGAVRLIFDLGISPSSGDGASASMRVVGASTAPAVLRLAGSLEGLSITLHAGSAAALLGLPAGEVAHQAVPLADLWGGDGRRLADQLHEAQSDDERALLALAALRRRLLRANGPAGSRAAAVAAQLIAKAGGRLSLREAADAVGLGERRLQQLFFAHVGVSFRAYTRLARLHACLRLLRGMATVRWADVAVDAGFSDQAHLAKEFRALCGLSPSVFLLHRVAGTYKTSA